MEKIEDYICTCDKCGEMYQNGKYPYVLEEKCIFCYGGLETTKDGFTFICHKCKVSFPRMALGSFWRGCAVATWAIENFLLHLHYAKIHLEKGENIPDCCSVDKKLYNEIKNYCNNYKTRDLEMREVFLIYLKKAIEIYIKKQSEKRQHPAMSLPSHVWYSHSKVLDDNLKEYKNKGGIK